MKKLNLYKIVEIALFTLIIGVLASSCVENFDQLNVSPTAIQEDRVNENLLFSRSLIYGALRYTEFQRAQHLHANKYIQYYAVAVDRFETDRFLSRNDWLTDYWRNAYADFGMQVHQVIRITERDEEKVNKTQIARIWKVFIMHRLTDFWGDIPYSEAFTGDITPAYDRQEDIYLDMLNELKEAVESFDPSRTANFGASDLLYGSNITSWTKFANSLRLRLAMRISNVAPMIAQQHINEVIASGDLISSNEESAVIRYGRDFGNADENIQPMALIRGFDEYRASKTLVDLLVQNNDPRIPIYLTPNQNGQFVGLQNGLNPEEINLLDPNDFSQDSQIISNAFAPSILLGYAEVLFLKAEAALRGWGDGDIQGNYENGIRASINHWVDIYENLQGRLPASDASNLPVIQVSNSDIEEYLQRENILFNQANALEQIITQKWLSNINQGFEAYADYRRTGFPLLNPIPNTDGLSETGGSDVPRRVRYPAEEQALNRINYEKALRNQGADLPTTRMWWDVQ